MSSALQRLEDRPRGEDARLHRVVDPLQRGDVDQAGGVTGDEQAVAVQPLRDRVEAAFGNRLRAPLDHLAALEVLADAAGAT